MMKRSRSFLILYLAAVHLAVLVVIFLYKDAVGLWFFAIEATLLVSWLIGLWLVRRATAPAELLESFSSLLEESEFTTRLSPTGFAESDAIIDVYNRMLETLHDEYLRIGEQRGFFEQFLLTAPVGVLILDFDQAISVANPMVCQLMGTDAESLQGRKLAGLDQALAKQLQQMGDNSETIIGHSGTRRIRIQKSAFRDRGFERAFYLFEELTRVLADSEKQAYEKLIRTMSHEVNNTVASTSSLLQSCLNYADQLNAQDEGDYRTALDVAIRRNQRLNEFMKAYADVVKLPAPHKRETDLVAMLDQMMIMFRAESDQRSIEWVAEYGKTPLMLMLDRNLIEQALINICRNAMDAIGNGGRITVSVTNRRNPHLINGGSDRNSVCLAIIDSADGLADKDISQLFSPFYTTRQTGQGIGLTLVKEILTGHGFAYDLRRRDDEQTEFLVWMTGSGNLE